MTKEQYYTKYGITDSFIKADLEAVIANEIEKALELKKQFQQKADEALELNSKIGNFGNPKQPTEQPELNPIAEAYERGEKIRYNYWRKNSWIKKHSDKKVINQNGVIAKSRLFDFIVHPDNWELYTEPTEQPSSQVKLDNSFDKDRFEAMFRAVVESGENTDIDYSIKVAENALKQLDAYYASKEGGNNE